VKVPIIPRPKRTPVELLMRHAVGFVKYAIVTGTIGNTQGVNSTGIPCSLQARENPVLISAFDRNATSSLSTRGGRQSLRCRPGIELRFETCECRSMSALERDRYREARLPE